jgi:hypothetical protein
MNAAYHNALRDHGKSIATHVGLVDELGVELTGGGYARIAEAWANDGDGVMRLAADRTFDVPAGKVAGWQAYSAAEAGTGYGINAVTEETYAEPGQYILRANLTAVSHQAPGA